MSFLFNHFMTSENSQILQSADVFFMTKYVINEPAFGMVPVARGACDVTAACRRLTNLICRLNEPSLTTFKGHFTTRQFLIIQLMLISFLNHVRKTCGFRRQFV